ncbi:MAG TPA: glycoside hydrolase family 6 protein, partial [Longimicrobiaceae bacterium]|nr:glycoside hydrolase family 6 protein [Longimicrobiaceae bacterium]
MAPDLMETERDAPAAASPTTPSAEVNPLQGTRLYVVPGSNAQKQADTWRQSRAADAAQMDRIAAQPQAIWFGDWNPDPFAWVSEVTRRIRTAGSLPVYVLYNIPKRDCGLYSSGGASGAGAYQRWISEVARGIGSEPAVVVLEPDAIAGMDCLSAAEQSDRLAMIVQAVRTLKAAGRITVYIDAGNARWHSPDAIADRLRATGIAEADGFALNISNFLGNDESIRYGDAVSRLVGGKHFIVDTSRNGAGPTPNFDW